MSLRWVTLDVFAEQAYRGNPVAIIHVPATINLSQKQKQLIAREFNLSESVFLHEQTDADKQKGDVRIDIFTPIAEVPFAGHPTVGTANYLLRYMSNDPEWHTGRTLQAKAGPIPIKLGSSGRGITLAVAHNVHIHRNNFHDLAVSQCPLVSIVKGMTFLLVRTDSLHDLAKPTQSRIGEKNTYTSAHVLDEGWQQGLIGSYFYHDLGLDQDGVRQVRTRMLGSREDPATGSAASALCSYLTLSEQGVSVRRYAVTQGVEMGRESLIELQVTLTPDGSGIEEVLLSGTAEKVMEGTLRIPSADLV